MQIPQLRLAVLSQEFAVCKLAAGSPVPSWVSGEELVSVTQTPAELSIVCPARQVPPDVTAERGWAGLRIEGTLDFSLTGILAALLGPLAEAGISVFAMSTFDTDYLLVRRRQLDQTVDVLTGAGFSIGR